MNKTIMPFLLGTILVAAGCSTNSQNKSNAASMSSAFGNGYTIHGGDEATPQPIDGDADGKKRQEDHFFRISTEAIAKDMLKKKRYDDAAKEYWEAAIKNPRACKSLLIEFYSKLKSKKTETTPSEYADRYLGELANAICPKDKARQLVFPCFVLVTPEEKIKKKMQEWWCSRNKDDIECAIEFAQRRVKVKDGLFVRELKTEDGGSIPILSDTEAKSLLGDVRSSEISNGCLCLLDKSSAEEGEIIYANLAKYPYLELCKREFRIMCELCRHLGAASVRFTDLEDCYNEAKKHGVASISVNTPFFGGVGKAEYKETYSQYKSSFASAEAKFNSGKGSNVIKRGRDDYSWALQTRLENREKDFCDLENARKDSHNQITHWEWKYCYEEKGDRSLMAKLKIGCRIFGIPIGSDVSASWEQTEKWERNKKWYLLVTFPESKIVD